MMADFERDVIFAESGEEKAWWLMANSPKTKNVLDVRKDAYFQAIDIDFLQLTLDGKVNKIEVKSDRQAHTTGNIVYEVKSNGNAGCLERSNADYVCYYLTETRECYVIQLDMLRGYVKHKGLKAVKMGDGAMGYLIPIADLTGYQMAVKL